MSVFRPREGSLVVGKYRLVRPLASGGMGAVWVATDVGLGRSVAVKFMAASLSEHAQMRVRFEREARAAAVLRTPHVVQIFDHGVDGDVPFIVMELLDGESLGGRLTRERRLDLQSTARIVAQIAKGLARAHEAGIIHRDLKPANVFMARDGEDETVKILDFGVAKMHGLGETGDQTESGVLVGSMHYMSPEQARGTRALDARSDLWSLGVIAYRALTGRLPFEGSAVGDLLLRICTEPVPSASSRASDVPAEVDAFFERALAREPEDRFSSAKELADALATLAGLAPSAHGLSWPRGSQRMIASVTGAPGSGPAAAPAAVVLANAAKDEGTGASLPGTAGPSTRSSQRHVLRASLLLGALVLGATTAVLLMLGLPEAPAPAPASPSPSIAVSSAVSTDSVRGPEVTAGSADASIEASAEQALTPRGRRAAPRTRPGSATAAASAGGGGIGAPGSSSAKKSEKSIEMY